jgi:hypothetical protein
LSEEFDSAELARLRFENLDEAVTDPFAFNSGSSTRKSARTLGGIDVKALAKALGERLHTRSLVLAQESIIDEHADQRSLSPGARALRQPKNRRRR